MNIISDMKHTMEIECMPTSYPCRGRASGYKYWQSMALEDQNTQHLNHTNDIDKAHSSMTTIKLTATITVLLATAICGLLAEACPLGSSPNCEQECQAYKEAEAVTSPVYLNVNATLSNFLNNPDEFNQKLGTDYEKDSISGVQGQACYAASNAEVGCKEYIEVDGACSWTYQCDYDKNRLPLYIWRASCGNDSEIIYPVPVLKRSDSCNPQPTWQLVMEKVPVGCSF